MLTIQVTPNRSAHMPNSSPHICFSSGDHDRAAVGELLPVAAQLVVVVAAEADRVVVAGGVVLPGRVVGGHQREAGVGLELAVHDLVGVAAGVVAEVAERVDVELAAEHVLVELQRLAGVAVEADVGVEFRGHWSSSRLDSDARLAP